MARPTGPKVKCGGRWTQALRELEGRGHKVGRPYLCSTFGYWMVNVDRVPKRVHRIIWEYHNGPIPEGYMIDHKDGDKSNCSLDNLRLATNQQNSSNREVGDFTNIDIRGDSYRVKIKFHGKTLYFGTYKDLELAQLVRDEARVALNGEFHGRR